MGASTISQDIAAAAARLVVDEGMDYANAKRKAARGLGEGLRNLPGDELVEDHVREHIAIFHADTQPRELALLRRTALAWMTRLDDWNPHLAGAAWRGTATARSVMRIELYADDAKLAQFALLDLGVDDHAPERPGHERSEAVLSKHVHVAGLNEPVTIDFIVHDADALRGALKPDGRGRRWRGDVRALRELLAREHGDAAGRVASVVEGPDGG
jgi:hypothetical protein